MSYVPYTLCCGFEDTERNLGLTTFNENRWTAFAENQASINRTLNTNFGLIK